MIFVEDAAGSITLSNVEVIDPVRVGEQIPLVVWEIEPEPPPGTDRSSAGGRSRQGGPSLPVVLDDAYADRASRCRTVPSAMTSPPAHCHWTLPPSNCSW